MIWPVESVVSLLDEDTRRNLGVPMRIYLG